jgi:biotin operon repressor
VSRSLKTEFAQANMPGVKTITKRGAVWVEMPIARLSGYQFSSSHDQCSWKTPSKKVVIRSKGFAVEQEIKNEAFYMVFRVPRSESSSTILKNTSAIRGIFFRRSLRAIEELQSLDEKTLAEAVQAPTDYSVLLSALNTEEALASIRPHDPLAGARLRGLETKRKLLEAEGGALSTAEIAKALRITRQAVDKRRKERKLLGVEVGRKGFRYPAWQVGLAHLEEILRALGDTDSWEQIAFFLNPSALLEDRTPREILLKGKRNIDDVLRAASAYSEQGG